jgi:putative ABC transport system substrate-binding protein
VGYLAADAPPTALSRVFAEALRDLGYIEGQTVEIVYRGAAGREEQLPELAAELVQLPVDVILAQSAVAARAAKDATDTIPIVNGASNDPVEAGLATSLARPGGNVTGLSLTGSLLVAKRLELLKAAVPQGKRFAALGYAAGATLERDWAAARDGARTLGLQVERYDVADGEGLPAALSALAAAGAEALLVLPNMFFSRNRERLVDEIARKRLPAIYELRSFAEAGGLMSYGADVYDLYRRAASYVDKILKGANPAELPIEQPTKFDFVINLRAAQTLGLTFSEALLQQATSLIQ